MGSRTTINLEKGFDFKFGFNPKIDLSRLKRGDIVIVDFGINPGCEKDGIRPAVIVSNNYINSHSDNVTVVPTTALANRLLSNVDKKVLDTHVILSSKFYRKLNKTSVAQAENIRTISKIRIMQSVGHLSELSMKQLNHAIKIANGLAWK